MRQEGCVLAEAAGSEVCWEDEIITPQRERSILGGRARSPHLRLSLQRNDAKGICAAAWDQAHDVSELALWEGVGGKGAKEACGAARD